MLIAVHYAFYIGYPKSAPAQGFLLFIQELFLERNDMTVKHSTKYKGFINSVLK